ncbi:MAG: hypothetical protein AAF565_14315, partial [Pseudomonadota bacterium]
RRFEPYITHHEKKCERFVAQDPTASAPDRQRTRQLQLGLSSSSVLFARSLAAKGQRLGTLISVGVNLMLTLNRYLQGARDADPID